MKHLKTILAVAVMALAMALPSISTAQYSDQRLDDFLNHHPDVRHDLERNPDLIYNSRFRQQHVELEEFMQSHPGTWGKLPNANRWGGYGPDHNWHDRDWWNAHDPNWVREHHPDWSAHEEHHAAEVEHYPGNPHPYPGNPHPYAGNPPPYSGTPANQPHHHNGNPN